MRPHEQELEAYQRRVRDRDPERLFEPRKEILAGVQTLVQLLLHDPLVVVLDDVDLAFQRELRFDVLRFDVLRRRDPHDDVARVGVGVGVGGCVGRVRAWGLFLVRLALH